MMVAGLGNPGPRYAHNRHNVGFLFADWLAGELGASGAFRYKSSFDAEVAECRLGAERLWLVKPQAFMNLSGGPLSRVAAYYKVVPRDVAVVYDDVALPFGSIRIKPSGSAGGHNGMQSIIEQFGTDQFPRVRVGIASEAPRGSLAGYVLSDFAPDERRSLAEVFGWCREALELILGGDVERAMARFNRRSKTEAAGPDPVKSE
jgi:PTH1 family peptidyl-tRNA hydrolase